MADTELLWKSHVRNLFDEILTNPGTSILRRPLQITISILGVAAQYAADTNNEVMIGYFARLAIYTFSDPTNHAEYDKERTDYYIKKTQEYELKFFKDNLR